MNNRTRARRPRLTAAVFHVLGLSVILLAPAPVVAQHKLPPPERIVGDYVKAVGGKKRLAALRDATYVWEVRSGETVAGTARTQTKTPASARADFLLAGGELNAAANARSAWERASGGTLRTLTDREAYAARLQAALDASRLLDFRKQKVLARTAGVGQVEGAPAYVVEFSTRAGARLRYYFAAGSRLLVRTVDEARGLTMTLSDYRADAAGGPLEPHRLVLERRGRDPLTLMLREARYNTGLADSIFDPPGDSALDVPALLAELARNQTEVDERVNNYTFTRKVTERKVNDRGEVTKETVNVYEVYPVANYGPVMKLTIENGMPLAPERAAKEELRVAEELAKAEREAPKNAEKRVRRKAEQKAKREREGKGGEADGAGDDDVGISAFLRACEFVAPRRERLREREAIVFDFRPRAGFKPSTTGEKIISKLAGTIWVDPSDRQVMRLEGHLVDSFKMGGGLFASVKPGSAFVFEQARMDEGVWLPRFSQVNVSLKLFLVKGVTVNETNEFGDYKLFSTRSGEAALDAPKP